MTAIHLPNSLSVHDCAFIEALGRALVIARKKYPGCEGRYVALTGEAGEVMHEWQKIMTKRGSVKALSAELLDLAAMCVRLAVEGDASLPYECQDEFPCVVQPGTIPSHSKAVRLSFRQW